MISAINIIRPWLHQGGVTALSNLRSRSRGLIGRYEEIVLFRGQRREEIAEDLRAALIDACEGQLTELELADGQALPGTTTDRVVERALVATRVLVVCRAGQSRSASLCVRLLMAREGLDREAALGVVFEALRPMPGADSRFEPSLVTLESMLGSVDRESLRRELVDHGVDFI